jgi:2-dehydropantoate 2-reductase
MKILFLGAGGVGGYFGGRLIEAGVDVTFQLRSQRAQQLAKDGLVINSPLGDAKLPVKTIVTSDGAPKFDLVILACKAYDLIAAIEAIRAHVARGAIVLPLLNGIRHIDELREAFPTDQIIGGICQIEAVLNPAGVIQHKSPFARLIFGLFADQATGGAAESAASGFAEACAKAGFTWKRIDPIDQSLWDKWVLIATLAGITTLMRGSVGDVMAAKEGREIIEELLQEAIAVASESGYAPSGEYLASIRKLLMAPGSSFMASMLRDMEKGGPVEAEHIIGDMYHRAHEMGIDATILRLVYCHAQAYEARRKRNGLLAD